jgi:hypothetical protein
MDALPLIFIGLAGICLVWMIKRTISLVRSPLHVIAGPSCYNPLGMLLPIMRAPPYQFHLKWANKFGGLICYRRFPLEYVVCTIHHPSIHITTMSTNHNQLIHATDYGK